MCELKKPDRIHQRISTLKFLNYNGRKMNDSNFKEAKEILCIIKLSSKVTVTQKCMLTKLIEHTFFGKNYTSIKVKVIHKDLL